MDKQQGAGELISDKQTIRLLDRFDQITKTTAGILQERKKVYIVSTNMQNHGQLRYNLMSRETEGETNRVN